MIYDALVILFLSLGGLLTTMGILFLTWGSVVSDKAMTFKGAWVLPLGLVMFGVVMKPFFKKFKEEEEK